MTSFSLIINWTRQSDTIINNVVKIRFKSKAIIEVADVGKHQYINFGTEQLYHSNLLDRTKLKIIQKLQWFQLRITCINFKSGKRATCNTSSTKHIKKFKLLINEKRIDKFSKVFLIWVIVIFSKCSSNTIF